MPTARIWAGGGQHDRPYRASYRIFLSLTQSGLEQTVKSVGQDSIRILPVVYASESELVARRAGVARSPLRAVTCNWKPIASSTLRTVLKFGCVGLPAKAR